MKAFTLSIIALAMACTDVAQPLKSEADSLYAQECYEQAAKIYQQLLEQDGDAVELYYNLGNCYYKTENIPYAILNYERALRLSPGDGDIRANLALARSHTTDKVTPASEMFFVTWWKRFTNSMSLRAWTQLAVIAFILMLLGILAYMFLRGLTLRKIGAYGAIALLAVTVIANLCILTQHSLLVSHTAAIVIEPAVTVKSSPSQSSTDLFIIHEGSRVEILDDGMNEWREVKLEEGKQGWIPSKAIENI